MNAQTDLFHPNTRLYFMEKQLLMSVSLCVSKNVADELLRSGKKIKKGRYRYITYLTYSTTDISRNNLIHINTFLLNALMYNIRIAKQEVLKKECELLLKF